MRSRYTAYARHDMAYLMRTWDAATRPVALNAEPGLEWLGLSILSVQAGQEGDDNGRVEFVARYRAGTQEGELHENSRFRKLDGAWYYLDGKMSDHHSGQKTGRNDPCPCGSGKKFKKCCGG